jgi:hypothetical protein
LTDALELAHWRRLNLQDEVLGHCIATFAKESTDEMPAADTGTVEREGAPAARVPGAQTG